MAFIDVVSNSEKMRNEDEKKHFKNVHEHFTTNSSMI